MSEQPTADVPEATAERRAQVLTAERIESILADFRGWLHEAAARGATTEAPESQPELIDLHTLLGQFAALRHEVNLQTKAVRAQQELNAETLVALQVAMEPSPAPAEDDDDANQKHARTLIEIHDALALATREAKRMRDTMLPQLGESAMAADSRAVVPAPPETAYLAVLFG